MSTIHALNYGDGTNTVPASAVTRGTAKAWVNFNGTGTPAIRDSENLSSLTDNGTGSFRFNLTSAMANTNATCTSFTHAAGVAWMASPNSHFNTASQIIFDTASTSSVATDALYNGCDTYGDLA